MASMPATTLANMLGIVSVYSSRLGCEVLEPVSFYSISAMLIQVGARLSSFLWPWRRILA